MYLWAFLDFDFQSIKKPKLFSKLHDCSYFQLRFPEFNHMPLEIVLENYFLKNRNMIWKHISRGPQRKQATFPAYFLLNHLYKKKIFPSYFELWDMS